MLVLIEAPPAPIFLENPSNTTGFSARAGKAAIKFNRADKQMGSILTKTTELDPTENPQKSIVPELHNPIVEKSGLPEQTPSYDA